MTLFAIEIAKRIRLVSFPMQDLFIVMAIDAVAVVTKNNTF